MNEEWVTVPREPTEEMVEAGARDISEKENGAHWALFELHAIGSYRAMLAAAPSPTVEGEVGLLKRLQNYEEVNCLYGGDYVPSAICREAAAAITRLQAENERLTEDSKSVRLCWADDKRTAEANSATLNKWYEEAESLRERVAKLEEALEFYRFGNADSGLAARAALTGDSK